MLNKDYVDGLQDLVHQASKYGGYDGPITREYLLGNLDRVVDDQVERFLKLVDDLDKSRVIAPALCENLYCEW